ncbi:MAG: hypothetical protein IPP33_03725 [Flavobacteriales bacterium]|nr:hypothetical protein [Flavobacteriales bacterium]
MTGYPARVEAATMRTNAPGDFGYSERQGRRRDRCALPGIGALVGGSQREERLDVLEARMNAERVPAEELWWYLDARGSSALYRTRRSWPRSRGVFVLFVTGMGNIRDVIPFPRTPKECRF